MGASSVQAACDSTQCLQLCAVRKRNTFRRLNEGGILSLLKSEQMTCDFPRQERDIPSPHPLNPCNVTCCLTPQIQSGHPSLRESSPESGMQSLTLHLEWLLGMASPSNLWLRDTESLTGVLTLE